MADFKLGRIRFVWKGEWTGPSTYYKDDVVRFGGKTFICLIGHTTSATFNDDLNANEPRWEQMSDGVTWKGDWAPQTVYGLNDIVKYGGMLYICSVGHTSDNDFIGGLENELGVDSSNPKWDLFCEGFDYLGAWVAETRYKLNDVVKYGAKTYICLEGHVAADVAGGILANADKWEVFSEGLEWQGDWQTSTRYKQSEVVKYGGQIYICNTEHTSAATESAGLEANQSNWDYLHQGIQYRDDWQQSTRYRVNDVVKNGGGLWICTTHHTSGANDDLRQDESNWSIFLPGLEFEDTWNSATSYQSGDIVTYGGYTYIAITNNINVIPYNNTSDWDLFVTGFNLQGDYDNGTAYKTGDVVRLGGWTYIATADTTGNRPPNVTYWDKLNEGAYWKDAWTDVTYYDKGDVVSYGSNSYICILEHTSDENPLVGNNRPDQDIAGTYWNIVSGGVESANLTTAGDLVYYGGAGPTRLPVGAPGQVLQVNPEGDAPIWSNFGYINHVYYVEPITGADEPTPGRGITIDRPFKSVRYACQQIEKGAAHYNAKIMLEHNRSFIQAEVVEWVDYQIANNIAPFISAFTYDKEKCRRDTGIIVDAITWDLSHGGNVRSRQAALEYFTSGGLSYISGQEDETVAALDYALEVMTAVLSNLAPAANYQTLNSVGSPITQQIDGLISADNESLGIVTNLLSIVTDAITAGNTNSIPAELVAQKTVFVKTGETKEVSPVIVPENTAIVGDELRSTRIGLAGSLVDSADTPYSLQAIGRLRDVISDVVTNTPVTATTTGDEPNTETQVTTRPAGGSNAGTEASDLMQEIYDYIDWAVNGVSGDSTEPQLRGVNNPVTSTDYTYAVETLEANKDFLAAEAVAYVHDQNPGIDYSIDACKRDVKEYIDGIKHDLIYTGNYNSITKAKVYANSVVGSRDKDLFYLRNGTGLRNCTLFNATATLSSPNQYGTSRPLGGAYTSLDPGWGPEHAAVWIKNKSPYVQNVTTFGDACVGCKVDGNLHNGGNDSIVANDFTQILSDGIGYWVTNLGRAELVSVFCYYNHIGYLAENGGKIRATNGNNSYGDFGSVAEGIDETETPVLGVVDNRQLEAQISLAFTDGTDEILQLEYLHAGEGYTTATDAIIAMNPPSAVQDNTRTTGTYKNVSGTSGGSGTGQEFTIVVNEVGGVEIFEITKGGSGHAINDVITFDASEIGGTGSGFTASVSNIGDATRFTISGEGFGAIVNAAQVFDGAVKEVRLTNPSDNFGGEGYVTIASNAQAGNATQITLSATDVRPDDAYNGMAIYLTSGRGAGQYGYITDFNSGNKIATISKMSDGTPGWDHVVDGTTIETFLDTTTAYDIAPRVEFSAPLSGLYADTARGRARVSDDQVVEIRITHPGQGYVTPPTVTITDPNELTAVPHEVRLGDGVLGQPTWTNRGSGFVTASATVVGDGFSDIFQNGTRVRVDGLSDVPLPGSNVEFASIPNTWFKLVTVTSLIGNGPYSAILQVSPEISVSDNLPHDDAITIRRRFSQVRLTGHDFLDIGTGNFTSTNYPNDPLTDPDPNNETNDFGGGRVFYTSTDQDGNFRVGGLFNVEQATGIATLNVEAFNISGLNELQLGSVALGGTGAIITEFSTDGTFAADSDSVVPTQKAIKTYITSQIGGGAATLNVNSLTAGVVQITGQQISTVDGSPLNINTSMTFNAPVDGAPIALQMFLLN